MIADRSINAPESNATHANGHARSFDNRNLFGESARPANRRMDKRAKAPISVSSVLQRSICASRKDRDRVTREHLHGAFCAVESPCMFGGSSQSPMPYREAEQPAFLQMTSILKTRFGFDFYGNQEKGN